MGLEEGGASQYEEEADWRKGTCLKIGLGHQLMGELEQEEIETVQIHVLSV